MLTFTHLLYNYIIWFFVIYSVAVFLIYGWIAFYSLGAVLRYKNKNNFTDFNLIATNKNTPSFSLIAPAYNEGVTIVENVRSLLSLYYNHLEIIIVNDGSKDDSVQKLIDAYDLEIVPFFIQGTIKTSKVRGVYKSKNPAFKKLVVVDKENGGKADALNVGINISTSDYIVCIDVDCILEQDAILKLAKPFLEETNKKVIACGGVIRLANNCKVENGKVTEVNLPKTWLGRNQAIEYIRAFVLGRMAWSRASGLLLISGAFGAFDRKIVVACGGYDRNTVGEDMELVVRMRRYMEDQKQPYQVVNIPDPLCWTEVPESKEILVKQRNRWMRGTMETLWKHRKMMFDPQYGKLGMISLPYWFFIEFLGPLVEFFGFILFILFLLLGIVNWPFFVVLTSLVLSTGILYSIYAILIDLIGYQVYSKRKDFLTLFAAAVIEPFYFHPIVVKSGVKGVVDYFKGTHSWGDMTRKGFQNNDTLTDKNAPLKSFFKQSFSILGSVVVVLLPLFFIGVIAESWWYYHQFPEFSLKNIAPVLFVKNIFFVFKAIVVIGFLYLLLKVIVPKIALNLLYVSAVSIVVLQYIFFLYFSESHVVLGADFLYYNKTEMIQILKASGITNFKNIAFFLILLTVTIIPFWLFKSPRYKRFYAGFGTFIIGVCLLVFNGITNYKFELKNLNSDFETNAAESKWNYFLESVFSDYLNTHPELNSLINGTMDLNDENVFNKDYPFLKKETTPDLLGNYLTKTSKAPNLVFIVVEGLGQAYSSPNGYVGNFTPYLDSLAQHSLYWEYCLSSSGRTFAAIPTLTGSLPFGNHGFLEQTETIANFNLFNILKTNGFETGFYYGSDAAFDGMKKYLTDNQVDEIVDVVSFDKNYKKLPSNNGESWGFEDEAVFTKMIKDSPENGEPYFKMILTLSTHNPFLINNSAYYEKLFNKTLASGTLSLSQQKIALQNKKQLISVLNLDDALKTFFNTYQKRADFNETLFVITGDHAMPEIEFEDRIDRYQVPLIIYSPLLKQPKRFKKAVSHFDVAPSLVSFYRNSYQLKTPNYVTWIGDGLKEDNEKRTSGYPMMQTKSLLVDFVFNNYYLAHNDVFLLNTQFQEEKISNDAVKTQLLKSFKKFKAKNNKFSETAKLMPDSVYSNYIK